MSGLSKQIARKKLGKNIVVRTIGVFGGMRVGIWFWFATIQGIFTSYHFQHFLLHSKNHISTGLCITTIFCDVYLIWIAIHSVTFAACYLGLTMTWVALSWSNFFSHFIIFLYFFSHFYFFFYFFFFTFYYLFTFIYYFFNYFFYLIFPLFTFNHFLTQLFI